MKHRINIVFEQLSLQTLVICVTDLTVDTFLSCENLLFHHQALNIIGKDLEAAAFDEESGIPEAIEHKYLPVFGVQWHPERMDYNLAFHKIFV